MLMGYEISDLNLNCDLITLSACETGRGKLMVGEGILGLPRLFLSAGAKSVMMTLWKVDDLFASQLIPEFYHEYLNNNLPKVHALAQAKRKMLNKPSPVNGIYYQHPLFWASFTLFGDPGPGHVYLVNFKIILLLTLITAFIYLTFRKVRRT